MDRLGFWAAVDRTGDCWLWTASRGRDGYGQVRWRGSVRRAHRVAWELTYGPVPAGRWVLHRCNRRPCVRPAHLYLGHAAENNEDIRNAGHYRNGWGQRTHCIRGHPFDAANTYRYRRMRKCRQCATMRERERQKRLREEAPHGLDHAR